MKQHYFDVPFAFAGDQTAIPDPLQVGGTVSMTEGWNNNYQRNLSTDPAALPIDRSTTNWLLNQISTAIQALQQAGVPEFILASQNGGTPYSYGKGAPVLWSVSGNAPFVKYVSLTAGNTNTPSASDPQGLTTGWQAVVDPISTAAQASAGTDDASIMTPLKVAQQTALRALLAGSSSQVFNVATATAATQAVPLAQAQGMQRAYTGSQQLSGSATLTNSIAGNVVSFIGTAPSILTLPAASSMPTATLVDFINAGSAAYTVNAAGTDVILTSNGSSVSSISVPVGATLTLFASGTPGQWVGLFGSAVRSGRLITVKFYGTVGTTVYTPTPGTVFVIAKVKGGGGGSAGSVATGAAQCSAGGPGGEGSYSEGLLPVSAVAGTNIVVGGGGAPGAAGANGGNGGGSSFGGCVGNGAQGGGSSSATNTSTVAGVLGGSGATGGNIKNVAGNNAGISVGYGPGNFGIPGQGGGSGGGSPGNNAVGYGGGAGGTINTNSQPAIVGHSGFQGYVEVWEFGA